MYGASAAFAAATFAPCADPEELDPGEEPAPELDEELQAATDATVTAATQAAAARQAVRRFERPLVLRVPS